MSPTLRYFNGIPFVATPYQPGAYIRQDLFMSQFTLTCTGQAEYIEDDPRYGTFTMDSFVVLGSCGLIEEAISLAHMTIADNLFPISTDPDELAFYPEQIYIRCRNKKLVLSGSVSGKRINWCPPVGSSEEADLEIRIADLYSKAAFESGWDNYETARALRRKAVVLKGHLVNPQWRKHAHAALNSLTT